MISWLWLLLIIPWTFLVWLYGFGKGITNLREITLQQKQLRMLEIEMEEAKAKSKTTTKKRTTKK